MSKDLRSGRKCNPLACLRCTHSPKRARSFGHHNTKAFFGARCVSYVSSSDALVEWILARYVIRCVDDVHDLRRDPTHHDLEPLP
jgi:hypothetical protein